MLYFSWRLMCNLSISIWLLCLLCVRGVRLRGTLRTGRRARAWTFTKTLSHLNWHAEIVEMIAWTIRLPVYLPLLVDECQHSICVIFLLLISSEAVAVVILLINHMHFLNHFHASIVLFESACDSHRALI